MDKDTKPRPSAYPPIDYRMQIGTQRAAVAGLTVVLAEAHKRKLEAIDWILPDLGSSLTGRILRPSAERDALLATFRDYAALVEHFHQLSVARYGPGEGLLESKLHIRDLDTAITVGGRTHLRAMSEHLRITTKRDRRGSTYDHRASFVSFCVLYDLHSDDEEK